MKIFFKKHLPLVRKVAERCLESRSFKVAFRRGVLTLDDLISEGFFGLLHAVENYNDVSGIQFWTFAEHRVRGAMLDYLRKVLHINRTFLEHQKILDRCLAESREVTPDAYARLGNVSTDVAERRLTHFGYDPLNSFYISFNLNSGIDSLGQGDGDLILSKRQFGFFSQVETPENYSSRSHFGALLQSIIDELSGENGHSKVDIRKLFEMYYGQDLTMLAIAECFSVTEGWISKIISQTIPLIREKLRSRLGETVFNELENGISGDIFKM
ncbi:sigma-70 family RNA polymerase sigma factor [Candidatus Peregrinibacteria bacterium]|nr:sigma-70 family RNA polymerase sigma factor [Candidatus Peregrinibacteria bacterium]